ncbi:hypothetical protein LBMAG48_26890 [Phycisphaerae bacterium]|nr:hypothetical protein LBMAG48_26890 [Phycisphaerae bacterium]
MKSFTLKDTLTVIAILLFFAAVGGVVTYYLWHAVQVGVETMKEFEAYRVRRGNPATQGTLLFVIFFLTALAATLGCLAAAAYTGWLYHKNRDTTQA